MELKKLRISNSTVDTILSKFKSTFYKTNTTKAEEILKDKNKATKLLDSAMETAKSNRRGALDEIWEKLQLVFSLMKDWIKGDYKEIPKASLIIIVIGFIYLVTPIDIIPDFLPGGFIDDVVVLGFLLKKIGSDLDSYQIWKREKESIGYYDENTSSFFDKTAHIDMSDIYEEFERYLEEGNSVLDLGCGSGRDSKHFIEKGYRVTSVDGSKELCKLASDYIGQEVLNLSFKEIDFNKEFKGIWACASLLHLPSKQIPKILEKIRRSLKDEGVCYLSFKYGNGETMVGKRLFSCYTETMFKELIEQNRGFDLEHMWLTMDKREGHEEKWLNAIIKRRI